MSCLYLNSTMWVIVSVMFVSCDGRIVEDSVDEGGVEKVPEEEDMRELTWRYWECCSFKFGKEACQNAHRNPEAGKCGEICLEAIRENRDWKCSPCSTRTSVPRSPHPPLIYNLLWADSAFVSQGLHCKLDGTIILRHSFLTTSVHPSTVNIAPTHLIDAIFFCRQLLHAFRTSFGKSSKPSKAHLLIQGDLNQKKTRTRDVAKLRPVRAISRQKKKKYRLVWFR